MPGPNRPRRSKAQHKQWLAQKRETKQAPTTEVPREQTPLAGVGVEDGSSGAPGVVPRSGGGAEKDFRAYYEAQELFGTGQDAPAEYETLWRVLRSPLPTSVVVEQRHPSSSMVETRLLSDGWSRRKEFDKAGMSVWEIDGRRYSRTPGIKAWAERENRRGSLAFQELVSLVPALLLNPTPDSLCLDLCAAPGNKSAQLLKALRRKDGESPTGAVISGELDAHRCCIVLHRVLAKARSPASCGVFANAQHFPALLNQASGEKLPISHILADVPCSGDGTARKNMQVWHAWRRRECLELFSKQRNILLRALYLLPPGGVCAYSTCSLNPLENEAVVLSALRRWNRDEKHDAHVTLMDTCAACSEACGLRCDPGVTSWKVPSSERGGPIFSSWADVPEELRLLTGEAAKRHSGPPSCKWPLRQEMFPEGEDGDDASVRPDLMRNCARFYPQRGDTGGFFVALIQKSSVIHVEKPARPFGSTLGGKGQLAMHGRAHPLLAATWRRVKREDEAWIELRDLFGIDPAWAEDKLENGLLFWQCLGGEVARLSLVSLGVARIFDATPGDRKELPWVRLGTFLFEQLPKGLLSGIAESRWQVDIEGASIVASIVRRRVITLPAKDVAALLRAPNRQLSVDDRSSLPCALDDGVGLLVHKSGERRHVCGGILVGLEAAREPKCNDTPATEAWIPAVLTPLTLRLLVGNTEAAALLEEVENAGVDQRNSSVDSCCWAGVWRFLLRSRQ